MCECPIKLKFIILRQKHLPLLSFFFFNNNKIIFVKNGEKGIVVSIVIIREFVFECLRLNTLI